jgi:transposase
LRKICETLPSSLSSGGIFSAPSKRSATPSRTRHRRFLLRLHLQQIDALDAAIDQIDQEVDTDVEPFRPAIALLTTIPGVSELSARVILAEIGHDPGLRRSRL